MKKKIFSFAILICLLFSTSFLLFGCGEKQITMVQVADAITKYLGTKGFTCTTYYSANEFLNWQRRFERSDINTEHFATYDKLESNVTSIYVFKFTNSDDANNCAQKFNSIKDYDTYEIKQYGNLCVAISDGYGEEIFALIDKI